MTVSHLNTHYTSIYRTLSYALCPRWYMIATIDDVLGEVSLKRNQRNQSIYIFRRINLSLIR